MKLLLGDCLKRMDRLIAQGVRVDMVLTSPPYDNLRDYGKDFTGWGEHIWKPCLDKIFAILKDGGVCVWVVGDATINGSETGTSFKQALYWIELGGKLHDTMIWKKPNYAPMYPSIKRYDMNFEYMFILSKGNIKTFNPIKDKEKSLASKKRSKYKTSFIKKDGSRAYKESTNNNKDYCKRNIIWEIPNGQIRGLNHPAPFPEQLANDHILSWSNEGDTILDPFMGSGTTGKMAILLKRDFIGIEVYAGYFEISKKRIRKAEEHKRNMLI